MMKTISILVLACLIAPVMAQAQDGFFKKKSLSAAVPSAPALVVPSQPASAPAAAMPVQMSAGSKTATPPPPPTPELTMTRPTMPPGTVLSEAQISKAVKKVKPKPAPAANKDYVVTYTRVFRAP